MQANLFEVFNERDDNRRIAAIERYYTPDVTWTDDAGMVVGRDALQAKAKALLDEMPGSTFRAAGPVYQTLGLGFLAFEVGPDGGEPVDEGFDVALIRGDQIRALYTVLTGQSHRAANGEAPDAARIRDDSEFL